MAKNSIFKQADGEKKSRETCKQTFKNIFKIISKGKKSPQQIKQVDGMNSLYKVQRASKSIMKYLSKTQRLFSK